MYFFYSLCILLCLIHPATASTFYEPDGEEERQLLKSVQNNDVETLRGFLDKRISPDFQDEKERSLLARAAYKGSNDVLVVLLEHNAQVNLVDNRKMTPVLWGAENGRHESVRLLVGAGADVNCVDDRGCTALFAASQRGHSESVNHLRVPSLEVDKKVKGNTALWIACRNGKGQVVGLLLVAGASADLANDKGISPMAIASYGGHTGVVQALCAHGASPQTIDHRGISPLIIASALGHDRVIQELVKGGADVNYCSPGEMGSGSAYHYALQGGHLTAASYLKHEEPAVRERALRAKEQELSKQETKLQTMQAHYDDKDDPFQKLESKVAALVRDKEAEKTYLALVASVKSNKLQSTVLDRIINRLESFFLAYKVLDTGLFKIKVRALSKGIELLGNFVPLPFADKASKILSWIVNAFQVRNERQKISLVANVGVSFSSLDREIENFALQLACDHSSQIHKLTAKGAKDLADCAVRRIVEYIRNGKLTDEVGLREHMRQALYVFDANRGLFPFTQKKLETILKDSSTWTDKGVFQESGIEIKGGQRYVRYSSKVEVYDYRYGTQEEAISLGYSLN